MEEIQKRNILTINEAVKRAKVEGLNISETALRRWIKEGTLHVAFSGSRALIFWPNLTRLLCGE